MWLHKGADVTFNSEIQHPSTPRRQGQGGVHSPETGSGGHGSDVTARSMEGIRCPEDMDPEAREPCGRRAAGTMGEERGRQQVEVMQISRRIDGVKEASEWSRKKDGIAENSGIDSERRRKRLK